MKQRVCFSRALPGQGRRVSKPAEKKKEKKSTSQLHGFRYTASDLHPAEHKWVKRKYNSEQSPLLTPPGAYTLLQSARALFAPLGELSMSPTRLQVRSNGVGHQALFKMEKKKWNQRRGIDLKMSCCVISKRAFIWIFFSRSLHVG